MKKKVSKKIELKDLEEEIESAWQNLLACEIGELERITQFTQSVQSKLQVYYALLFPKKCNKCGRIYRTRDEYLKETERLKKISTIFDEAGLQEYRNCHCGSTLMLWADDRRDNTSPGKTRRLLFNNCLSKLQQLSSFKSEDEEKLRKIFATLSE